MKIPIFRKGQWIEYETPREVPSGWLPHHSFQAASVFATARSLGYAPNEAASLAEVYVFKQIFEGIQYDASFESKLQTLFNHEEITSDPTKLRKTETYEGKIQED